MLSPTLNGLLRDIPCHRAEAAAGVTFFPVFWRDLFFMRLSSAMRHFTSVNERIAQYPS